MKTKDMHRTKKGLIITFIITFIFGVVVAFDYSYFPLALNINVPLGAGILLFCIHYDIIENIQGDV